MSFRGVFETFQSEALYIVWMLLIFLFLVALYKRSWSGMLGTLALVAVSLVFIQNPEQEMMGLVDWLRGMIFI